jgi:hypothetical protein
VEWGIITVVLGRTGTRKDKGMASFPSEDERLKELFKTALLEVLEERKDLLRDVVEESLEDIALARAIDAGQRTGEVDRGEVISLLEGGH